MTRPAVHIIVLGGTITMAPQASAGCPEHAGRSGIAHKARLLLALLLGAGRAQSDISAAFAAFR